MPRDFAMKTGMLFGTFDGIHPGHLAMLREARGYVDKLIAVVPADTTVFTLKHRVPHHSWGERADALRHTGLVDEILEGDATQGAYSMVKRIHPDVLFLGYDQHDLRADLVRFCAEHHQDVVLQTLSPHQPDRYKSSLITPL